MIIRLGLPLAPVRVQSLWRQFLQLDFRAKLHRLHHLPEHAVPQDQHRGPVFVGKVEGVEGQISKLLAGSRGKDDGPVVTVSSAPCCLEVV